MYLDQCKRSCEQIRCVILRVVLLLTEKRRKAVLGRLVSFRARVVQLSSCACVVDCEGYLSQCPCSKLWAVVHLALTGY